jgi:hypothetical protein
MAESELDRLKARRVTALYRLDLIAQGAQLSYEDGAPIDMASEKERQQSIVADLDRRIEILERPLN